MNNFHIVVVHFPVVLAVAYGALELLHTLWRKTQYLRFTLWWVTFIGTLTILVARATGEQVEHIARWEPLQRTLLEFHSTLSGVLLFVFIVALCGYALEMSTFVNPKYTKLLLRIPQISTIKKVHTHPTLRVILAIASLVVITIIGGLGGALAHGCGSDPVTKLACTFAHSF